LTPVYGARVRIGSDTGGTFTDLVDERGRVAKVLSTPEDPAEAVRAGIKELRPRRVDVLAHGTTVATNALLEGTLAATALVTTEGFADVVEIGRQDRPRLYDQWADRPEPLVPRSWRLEVGGRLDAAGQELEPVGEVPDLPEGTEAVAVCLLHADLGPEHERAVADALAGRDLPVSLSSDVSPEFREFERTVTTVVNAGLGPVCASHLDALADVTPLLLIMTSAGGLVPAPVAARLPATLLLSGPAGGVRAAAQCAAAAGYPDAVTFDMGGTSTDVALVRDGEPEPAGERQVAGYPIRLPALNVHTIGAGGGSIATVDAGGALRVGPQSAGAVPGPACYGRGGTEPTVTDANLVAGRIPADVAFEALGPLDREAAERALCGLGIGSAEEAARGVLDVADAAMERAVRRVSVEQGVDPAGLVLVAFGGAGPLHACAIADRLGMAAVLVPPRAGVLSAVGMLGAPVQHDATRSWPTPEDHTGLEAALADLAAEAVEALVAEAGGSDDDVEVVTAVDARYRGQSHELRVPAVADFAVQHRRHNGYERPGHPVEVVALRASARRAAGFDPNRLRAPRRRPSMEGPAVVVEDDTTIWVPQGWEGVPEVGGTLVLRRRR
jgi:N-methylhydantoinase A/oxoprolinase/acetone carboxylase beta subunit